MFATSLDDVRHPTTSRLSLHRRLLFGERKKRAYVEPRKTRRPRRRTMGFLRTAKGPEKAGGGECHGVSFQGLIGSDGLPGPP